MNKIKAQVKKVYKTCSECGKKILKGKGTMSGGKFYCSACK
jgi:hypothetical protein